MNIALFYANWENFGEPWSTPLGVKWEFESRGHVVNTYNLYHNDGQLLPKKKVRTYSSECFNLFNVDYKAGYVPDALIVMDYGPFDCMQMDKAYYPGVPMILEAGDTPQSYNLHLQRVKKFDAVVTPDIRAAFGFEQMGVISKWMTHWADHRVFNDGYDIEPVFDCVTTCGGRKVTAEIQKELGGRFNNERYFFGKEHAERLRMGKMVFQCSQYGEITRRIFEGMACGRMVITDRLCNETSLGELFTEGEDIIYYSNAQEAIEKINYYSSHNEERELIAANGHAKVMANHTVANRVDQFEELISDIKLQTNIRI